ncbi:MAG: hypothetical protein AABX72_03910 [Nanoarchaeota archaeon]
MIERQFNAQNSIGRIYALLRCGRPDPCQFVWMRADQHSRRSWLIFAGLMETLAPIPWEKLEPAWRAQLARVMVAMTEFFADVKPKEERYHARELSSSG